MENFWAAIGHVFKWADSQEPFIVAMVIVGMAVTMISVYVILAYIVPAVVSVIIRKIRSSNFVRRLDRSFYLLRKEYGKSHRDGSR